MNRLYENYLTEHAGQENWASLSLLLDRDLLPRIPSETARCLDLGCGQGGLVAYLREKHVVNSFGVDISPEQVAQAHRLGREYVELGDMDEYLARSDSSWNVATAFDVLEHLDPERVLPLMEVVRGALAPGGLMIARLPNAAGPLSGRIQFGDFTHKSQFTATSLQQLANAAGFSRAEFREVPPPVHGAKSAARRAIWAVYAGSTRLAMAAESGSLHGHYVTSNFMAYLYV